MGGKRAIFDAAGKPLGNYFARYSRYSTRAGGEDIFKRDVLKEKRGRTLAGLREALGMIEQDLGTVADMAAMDIHRLSVDTSNRLVRILHEIQYLQRRLEEAEERRPRKARRKR